MSTTPYETTKGRRWRVRVYDAETKTMRAVSRGHLTKRDARLAEAAALAAGPAGERSRLTVAGWREIWLTTPRWKDSTRLHNTERTKAFADAHGTMMLADVDRQMARRWRDEHPSTTAALSAMWTAAAKDELLPVGQPWAGMATGGKRDLPAGWLTVEDIHTLRGHARTSWPGAYGRVVDAIIVMAAYTGIRPGELAALHWTDLQPAQSRLTVARQLESKTRRLTKPKNGRARVVVYPQVAQVAVAAMPRLHDDMVFVGPGGGLLHGAVRDRIWSPVRTAFGRPDMALYELRHYAATRLVELGMTSADVAVQLGHRDGGRLVESTYGHARPDPALARVARVLADAETATDQAEEAAS